MATRADRFGFDTRLSIRVTSDVQRRLEAVASERRRTTGSLFGIADLVREYCDAGLAKATKR